MNLLDYAGLAHAFACRYANRLGYADAYQEAFIALADARRNGDPERGPFQAIVRLYLRGHFANLIDKDDRRRGVPVHMRKSGKQRIKRGHTYERRRRTRSWSRTVSANQVGPDGRPWTCTS